MTLTARLTSIATALFVCAVVGSAQSKPDATGQADILVRAAIEARGGSVYLGIKNLVATGQYTQYDGGTPTVPVPFVDIIVYPNKERTEFGKGKKKDRRIQVNVGPTGWVYDGETETLKDQNEDQARDFVEGLQNDIDHILRGGWQAEGARTRFVGREETRPGERADFIEVEINPGRKVAVLLDRYTHLPLSVGYEKANDKGITRYETRFFQYIVYGGVKFPNIVDFYRDGVQISRINYQDIKLNAPIADEIFAKPASVKAVK